MEKGSWEREGTEEGGREGGRDLHLPQALRMSITVECAAGTLLI